MSATVMIGARGGIDREGVEGELNLLGLGRGEGGRERGGWEEGGGRKGGRAGGERGGETWEGTGRVGGWVTISA